jgi:hypothetical protein
MCFDQLAYMCLDQLVLGSHSTACDSPTQIPDKILLLYLGTQEYVPSSMALFITTKTGNVCNLKSLRFM